MYNDVICSVILDFLLAGSEVFHRVRLHQARAASQDGGEQVGQEGVRLQQLGGNV